MRTISRNQLQEALEAGNVIVVEALPPMYFEQQHIPGAINISHDEIEEKAPALLPDKDVPIVTYCANAPCPNSGIAARKLEALGYTNVAEYAEGKQDWVDAGLPTETGLAINTQ